MDFRFHAKIKRTEITITLDSRKFWYQPTISPQQEVTESTFKTEVRFFIDDIDQYHLSKTLRNNENLLNLSQPSSRYLQICHF